MSGFSSISSKGLPGNLVELNLQGIIVQIFIL